MFPGDTLPLSLQIEDGNDTKFVKAFLYYDNGTPFSTATIALAHLANGKYVNDSLTMPPGAFKWIDVTYKVFDDAGFTTLSTKYGFGTDAFLQEGQNQSGSGPGGIDTLQTIFGDDELILNDNNDSNDLVITDDTIEIVSADDQLVVVQNDDSNFETIEDC
jgi:hypothetical protein